MEILALFCVLFFVLFVIFLVKFLKAFKSINEIEKNSLLKSAALEKDLEFSLKNIKTLEQDLKNMKQKNDLLVFELNSKIYENTTLNAKVDEQKRINLSLQEDMESLNKQNKEYFDLKVKQMSESMLNLNSNELVKNTNQFMKQELEPLKARLENYEKELIKNSQNYKTSFDEFSKYTKDIMQKADNLANALLGNKKTLGNWGETQLDLILQNSGLILGSDYQKQVSYKDKYGKQKYIDVLVYLPEGKNAVIDAKVSLVNYTAFCNCDDKSKRDEIGKNLSIDVKNHINTLSSKEYDDYSFNTYEYTFMFIPNDGIFYVALEYDNTLYQYAYEKKVFITTPLTLLMALKTICICYKNMQSDKNAIKILTDAGLLYDKFVGFCEYFSKIETSYLTLGNNINAARKNLKDGSGNLLKRIENLRELDAKIKKKIPNSFFDDYSQIEKKDENIIDV